MRSIFTLLLFCLLGFQAKAQWVDLPGSSDMQGTCISYNHSLRIYQIDTVCAKSAENVDIMISMDSYGFPSDFFKYYSNALSFSYLWGNYFPETFFMDFQSLSENVKDFSIRIERVSNTGPNKTLILENLPESIERMQIHTENFNTYEIDGWPVSLKSLMLNGDGLEIDFPANFPSTLDTLFMNIPKNDISSIILPSALKSLSLSVSNFDYDRLNSLSLLKEAFISNTHNNTDFELNVNVKNSELEKLSITGITLVDTVWNRLLLNITNPSKSLQSLMIGYYIVGDIDFLENLKELELYGIGNDASTIVNSLPDELQKLKLSMLEMDTIMAFSKKLKKLEISDVNIASLPDFPSSLELLKLSNLNSLNSLPDFPLSLDSLMLFNLKNLQEIPNFPENLNAITLIILNSIKCLPFFPENLKSFTGLLLGDVKCIPNETQYVKATTEWPVCTDAQYICNAEGLIATTGTVYYDLNKNGVKDFGDIPVYGGIISINEETFATANKDGIYKVILREQGTFEIKAISNQTYYLSTTPNAKTIVYDENYVNDSVHFLIQVDDVKDLKITGTNLVARPGMQTSVTAFAENLGVVDLSDITIKIKKPQDWSVESVTPTGYRTDNDTIIWENVNLGKLSNTSFKVQTQLPATATILGNPYQYEMWVSSASQEDVTPSDNYYKIIDTIIGSYDPNDKIVNHTSLTPENSNAQELVYTIRFQNTGTDTAFKVVIVDTIIGNLDPSSIRVLGASHDFTWEYTGQGIAAFTFDNILLPDSNVNEPASHGFVTLAVKANKDLAVGDSIYNRAGIYFDFNEPVITNKALTRIATVTSVYTHANTSLKIYPNPAKDRVRVEWSSNERATLRLLDISGKVIQSQTLNQNYSDIDVSRLSKGMYLIQVQSAEGLSVGKLLIQ